MPKFLTDKTIPIYEELSANDFLSSFTFVGGSALAYYLHHRLSEDLDFFTWLDTLPLETSNFLNQLEKNHTVVVANSSLTYIDLFVDGVKVTLFANNWEVLKTKRDNIKGNIHIANLQLLSAMKTNALSLRAKYRDYYDLYVLNKEKFSIAEMLEYSLKTIPGMTKKVFCMQLTYIADIEDEDIIHLAPKINISLKDIQKHFEHEIKKII